FLGIELRARGLAQERPVALDLPGLIPELIERDRATECRSRLAAGDLLDLAHRLHARLHQRVCFVEAMEIPKAERQRRLSVSDVVLLPPQERALNLERFSQVRLGLKGRTRIHQDEAKKERPA